VGVFQKTCMQLPYFMETGDWIPARITEHDCDSLIQESLAGLRALGVRNSLAHVEIKLSSNGPQIIEAASRMGGDYTWLGVKEAFGFDMVEAGCSICLGIEVTAQASLQHFLCARCFIPRESGTVTGVRGIDAAEKHPGLVGLMISVKPGGIVRVPPDGFDSAGWIVAKGGSERECEQAMEEMLRMISIDMEPLPAERAQRRSLTLAT